MDIKFESTDKVSGKLTVNVTLEDYQAELEKSLKKFRSQARMNGFRPGCVPMGLVKKLYGPEAKAEEVSKAVSKGIDEYLKKNNIKVLGHVFPSPDQKEQDYKTDDNFTYTLDLAIEPEISVELGKDDKFTYYDIDIDDAYVDKRIGEICNRYGEFKSADAYSKDEKGAYLTGDLLEQESSEGEEPLKVEGVYISPEYVKDEEQKKLFDGAKKGDVITIKPISLYSDETQVVSMLKIQKEDLPKHSGNFTYTVTDIKHQVPAKIDQSLFDKVFGKDTVKDEKAFREKIREEETKSQTVNSDFKFYDDLKKYAIKKAGEMQFSEPMLKRLIKENNPKADDKFIDEHYNDAVEDLKWQLVRDRLVEQAGITADRKELEAMAYERTRANFAAYGMQLPDELIQKYTEKSLKDEKQMEGIFNELIVNKIIAAYKDKVTLEHKKISMPDFEKMVKEDYAEK